MMKWIITLFLFSMTAFASEGAHHVDEGIPYKTIITQVVNLLLLVALLVYLLRKPLAQHFAERKAAFHDLVSRAEKARAEAESAKRAISDKLSTLQNSANSSAAEAAKEAEDMRKKMIEEAKALSERVQAEAQRSAHLELERAKTELRTEMLKLAAESAENTLREKVGESEKKRLQDEFADKIQVVR